MVINETKYAALAVLKGGYAVRTDDIGCIFRMALLPPERWVALRGYPAEDVRRLVQVERVFVPDFNTGEYVEAQRAFYVIRQDMKTPMGDCVFAFRDREMAAKVNATVYTYDQMLQLYREVMQKTGMPRPNWCRGGMGGCTATEATATTATEADATLKSIYKLFVKQFTLRLFSLSLRCGSWENRSV
jgi:hypothetical protein